MSARLLDGRAIAADVTAAVGAEAATLARPPGLAVLLVGDDPASAVYVRSKGKMAEKLGFHHEQVILPAAASLDDVLGHVRRLNADDRVDGILVQLPLPKAIDRATVLDAIDPRKDADGFHPVNVGLLSQGRGWLAPCTPAGVMEMLRRTDVPLRGKDAVVVGRSDIVGRPMARLLEGADCTVTVAHSRTRNLGEHIARADVVVAAVGVRDVVRGDWIKPGAVVVDVGMNRREDGTLCGDIEFGPASERASWITPVPGGVGPMTIAFLMSNTLRLARARQGA